MCLNCLQSKGSRSYERLWNRFFVASAVGSIFLNNEVQIWMCSFEYANDCWASYYSYCLSVCLLVFNEANTTSSGSSLHRNHDSSCTAARQPGKKLSKNTLWSFSFFSPSPASPPLMCPEICLCLRPPRSELEQPDEGSDDETRHL